MGTHVKPSGEDVYALHELLDGQLNRAGRVDGIVGRRDVQRQPRHVLVLSYQNRSPTDIRARGDEYI